MSKTKYYVVSLSGGKDSTAMLLRLSEEHRPVDRILFCDTGLEFPQMYEHLTKLERYIGRPITRLKAEHSFEYYFSEYLPKRRNPALQQYKNIRNFRNRKMKVKSVKVKRLTARTRKALQASRKAVKGTVKATKATAKGTRRAIQAVKAAAKATVKFAKVAAKAIVAAVKATVAAVKGIVAAIAAGGWFAVVVVLLICAVGLVFGGVYSYVSIDEVDSERSLYQLVSVAESEYYDEIERLKSEYAYDLCDTTGTCIDRQLAVIAYLVERNLIGQDIVFDDARSEDFKQFYRLLHTSTLYSETVLQTETVWEQQEDGTLAPVERKVEKTKLYVNITSLNAEQIADYFDFDDGENKCFEGLLQVNFE